MSRSIFRKIVGLFLRLKDHYIRIDLEIIKNTKDRSDTHQNLRKILRFCNILAKYFRCRKKNLINVV